MTLSDWQRVAREFGDYRLSWEIMVQQEPEEPVGDWLPSEPTAKEILRLRKRVEVLEKVHRLVTEFDHSWMDHRDTCSYCSYMGNREYNQHCDCGLYDLRAALNAAKEAADG